jgi:hypothetical protein
MSRTSTSSSSELLRAHCAAIAKEETLLREGGGKAGHERQRKMGRLPVRERISHLLDKGSPFFEIGLWAAYKMYEEWGKDPGSRRRRWDWKYRGRSVHDCRQRRDREGRRVLSANSQESDSRPADRF